VRRKPAAVEVVATVVQVGVGGVPRSGMEAALSLGYRVRNPRVTSGRHFQGAAGRRGSAVFDATGALMVQHLRAHAPRSRSGPAPRRRC
jgi:hypothetical protein